MPDPFALTEGMAGVPLGKLFDSDSHAFRSEAARNGEIFACAYLGPDGPFERVCDRLRRGFSVLVHLPGNCMAPAARLVKDGLAGGRWTELGQLSDKAETMAEIWQRSTSVFDLIAKFRDGDISAPQVIFHNLDLLGDGHGGVDPSNEAKTALLYVIHSVRGGTVLGLSDRDAGELPTQLRRPFGDEIWLDEVPRHRFALLIPTALGRRLAVGGTVRPGTVWLLASRLRWTDPIRAVRIMEQVAKAEGDVDGAGDDEGAVRTILQGVLDATHSVQFDSPGRLDAGDMADGAPTGFEADTLDLLQHSFIDPFRRWAAFVGTEEEGQQQLRRLPAGLVLYGPPGTGKTSLARWIARSIAVPVRQVSASDLKRADWGLTEQLVKDLFRAARRAAPCVVVLDDADDLLPDRSAAEGALAGAERGIVNAFLQELEGFGERLDGVLVVLTTNRYDHLDQAAKSKIPIHRHIPYPVDAAQVEAIVRNLERSSGVDLGVARDELVSFFLGSTAAGATVRVVDPAARKAATVELFSPREIKSAMRLLPSHPGPNDIERMKNAVLHP